MKLTLLTALLTVLSIAGSIKLSDEGFVGCKNIQTYPNPAGGAYTLKRCFGKLSIKLEAVDSSAFGK